MKHSHILPLAFCIFFLTLFLLVQARHHSHTKHKHSHSHKSSKPSHPPAPKPSPPSPPHNENYNNASAIFDVRTFGAIGDGKTDDTESLKMAWDTACQSESAVNVILVPQGFSSLIQSTIFTGPCHGGLVLKVMYTYFATSGS